MHRHATVGAPRNTYQNTTCKGQKRAKFQKCFCRADDPILELPKFTGKEASVFAFVPVRISPSLRLPVTACRDLAQFNSFRKIPKLALAQHRGVVD
jgi:hypothetical protein